MGKLTKVVLLTLLLSLALSQTVSIDQVAGRPNRDEIYEKNGFKNIPTDDLADPFLFIDEIVLFTFPNL